jgi:hypothetical protein
LNPARGDAPAAATISRKRPRPAARSAGGPGAARLIDWMAAAATADTGGMSHRVRAAAAGMAWAAALGGTAPAQEPEASHLPSMTRLVRAFDFEEARHLPLTMPPNFYRYIAPEEGFPVFGRMQLSREAAHGGEWSLEFALDGGSMSARVPTAVIPVLPGVDYVVSAWASTEGLHSAAARLSASLHDARGDSIAGSRASSAASRAGGAWQRLTVEVPGDFDEAADLVVELEVLQFKQLQSAETGRPRLRDTTGRAWFDDVAIWQRPRIELSTATGSGVLGPGDQRALRLRVRDVLHDRRAARLRVHDIDGAVVHERDFALPRGLWEQVETLDALGSGWYRTVLEVVDGSGPIGARSLDFVTLPATGRMTGEGPHFGVALAEDSVTAAQAIGPLARQMLLSVVATPLAADSVSEDDLLEVVSRLADEDLELILSLPQPPGQPSAAPQGDARRVLEALSRTPRHFEDLLSGVAHHVGDRAPQFLLGGPDPAAQLDPRGLDALLADARKVIARFVPSPELLVPMWAEEALAASASASASAPADGRWVRIPHHVQPEAILQYAARWQAPRSRVIAMIEGLPASSHAPRERLEDLSLRALHAWRAGLERICIEAPWARAERGGGVVPQPEMPAWRVLAEHLRGRRFGGELPVPQGLRCWILRSGQGDDEALCVWNEHAAADASVLTMVLADGPVRTTDLLGNTRTVDLRDGVHTIPVGRLPSFIEGVDGRLASFRAAISIEPRFLPARHQVHEARLLLQNPWDVALAGTVQFDPPPGWRVTPRVAQFTISPAGEHELPIELVLERGALAGPSALDARIDLVAEREYTVNARVMVHVGLQEVGFAAHWHAAGEDLVVIQAVTNMGTGLLDLFGFVSAPGIARQRRDFATLASGQTAIRSFRVPGGLKRLAGGQLQVGVAERDGTARLNQVLEIPPTTP